MNFHVPNITCGHCERTIVRTLHSLDAQARVVVDIANKTVSVDGTLTAEQVAAALAAQDYPATHVSAAQAAEPRPVTNCCGSCRV